MRIDGKCALRDDSAGVVLRFEPMGRDPGFRVATVDGPKVRIRAPVSRQERWMHAKGPKPRELQGRRRKLLGPKPAHHHIRRRLPQHLEECGVDPGFEAHLGGVEGATKAIETDRVIPTNGRMNDLVTVARKQKGRQRQPKKRNPKRLFASSAKRHGERRSPAVDKTGSSPTTRITVLFNECSTSCQSWPRSVVRPRKPMGMRKPPLSRRPPP